MVHPFYKILTIFKIKNIKNIFYETYTYIIIYETHLLITMNLIGKKYKCNKIEKLNFIIYLEKTI